MGCRGQNPICFSCSLCPMIHDHHAWWPPKPSTTVSLALVPTFPSPRNLIWHLEHLRWHVWHISLPLFVLYLRVSQAVNMACCLDRWVWQNETIGPLLGPLGPSWACPVLWAFPRGYHQGGSLRRRPKSVTTLLDKWMRGGREHRQPTATASTGSSRICAY